MNTLVVAKVSVEETSLPKFFAHVNTNTGVIVSVSTNKTHEGTIPVPIPYEQALQFIKGEENITKWVGVPRDDWYVIIRVAEAIREKLERVKELAIFEITDPNTPYPEVRIEIGAVPDTVLVHFNGEKISTWKEPVKLYFTAEGDPSQLKCAMTLDVNTLNEIQRQNGLPEWPNPVELLLPEAMDISVYSTKSDLRMAITRHDPK